MKFVIKFRRNVHERYFVCKPRSNFMLAMNVVQEVLEYTEEEYLEIRIIKLEE